MDTFPALFILFCITILTQQEPEMPSLAPCRQIQYIYNRCLHPASAQIPYYPCHEGCTCNVHFMDADDASSKHRHPYVNRVDDYVDVAFVTGRCMSCDQAMGCGWGDPFNSDLVGLSKEWTLHQTWHVPEVETVDPGWSKFRFRGKPTIGSKELITEEPMSPTTILPNYVLQDGDDEHYAEEELDKESQWYFEETAPWYNDDRFSAYAGKCPSDLTRLPRQGMLGSTEARCSLVPVGLDPVPSWRQVFHQHNNTPASPDEAFDDVNTQMSPIVLPHKRSADEASLVQLLPKKKRRLEQEIEVQLSPGQLSPYSNDISMTSRENSVAYQDEPTNLDFRWARASSRLRARLSTLPQLDTDTYDHESPIPSPYSFNTVLSAQSSPLLFRSRSPSMDFHQSPVLANNDEQDSPTADIKERNERARMEGKGSYSSTQLQPQPQSNAHSQASTQSRATPSPTEQEVTTTARSQLYPHPRSRPSSLTALLPRSCNRTFTDSNNYYYPDDHELPQPSPRTMIRQAINLELRAHLKQCLLCWIALIVFVIWIPSDLRML